MIFLGESYLKSLSIVCLKMVSKIKENRLKNIFLDVGFLILTILIIILFYKKILFTTILLFILSILMLLKYKSKIAIKIFITGSILGALVEMICIYYGVWSYTFPNFVNIPLWLIPWWGAASLFIYRMTINVREWRKSKK